ncbi:mechanosensitive ion channel domain-containing protein [Novosphingobium sp.]|uniref:mechanosensitive ion channel family protein n=1 Tax=Novosphingobium sp. TaxID=1874826 RepID=UPI00333EB0B3
MNATTRHLSRQIRAAMDALDDISIDVGHYHISLANAAWMVLVITAALAFGMLGGRVARRTLRRVGGLDPARQVLGEKLLTLMIWAFAFFATIDQLGISLTAFTVFSGAFGLAIGFGLQKTFGNMIAGIILLMDRSIKPGDVIAVTNGTTNTMGVVNRIGVRAVSVTTLDNREYLIPNENLMTSQVENWSFSSRQVAVSIPVSVASDSDIDAVEALLLQAAQRVPRVLADPPCSVLVINLGPGAIDMTVSCWIIDPEHGIGAIRSAVLKNTWALFREHGVTIPYTQTDLHLGDSEGLRRLVQALEHTSVAANESPDH